MASDQRNPRWTAYPGPDSTQLHNDDRVRKVRLLGVASVVAALLLGVGAGSAYAYIKGASGPGSGHATAVGSLATVTVNAATATASLYPGGSGTVYFTLQNTNPLSVSFSEVTAASVTSTSNSSCPGTNITFPTGFPTTPYSFSPAITVGAGSVGSPTTSGTQYISGLVTLSSSAPNACQGVSFTVALTLSGNAG